MLPDAQLPNIIKLLPLRGVLHTQKKLDFDDIPFSLLLSMNINALWF